jgi:hypothetical protein
VPAVVGPGSHLVGVELSVVGHEELEAQYSHILQPGGDLSRQSDGAIQQGSGKPGRDHRGLQNTLGVMILPGRERRQGAVVTPGEHH